MCKYMCAISVHIKLCANLCKAFSNEQWFIEHERVCQSAFSKSFSMEIFVFSNAKLFLLVQNSMCAKPFQINMRDRLLLVQNSVFKDLFVLLASLFVQKLNFHKSVCAKPFQMNMRGWRLPCQPAFLLSHLIVAAASVGALFFYSVGALFILFYSVGALFILLIKLMLTS